MKGCHQLKVTICILLQLPSRVLEVELTTSSSNYHVEMNPSDVGNNDRYVVQEIIKVLQITFQSTKRVWVTL